MQQKKLTVFWLSLLITGGIDSIRNLPATALFGSNLIIFIMLGAVIFLIPTALVSAQLTMIWPNHGGIYDWVKTVFNKKLAFVAIWLQWFNTIVWFPTILSFLAGTASYLINPDLIDNKAYLILSMLTLFWFLTFINLRGIQTSARIASFCTIFGMVIPILLIVVLALYWVFIGNKVQINLTDLHHLPDFYNRQNWISLTAIMASFLGMEAATVHIASINNPRKTFPRALIFSTILILTTVILGSLSIAIVIPQYKIGLVSGVMQSYNDFLVNYNMRWMMPIIGVLIFIGAFGGMINWIISPAKGLLQAAQDGFLPKFLSRENKYAVPQNMLIMQAICVSIISLLFLLMPTVNSFYWFLTDLSTQLYMIMYIMMFAVAIKVAKSPHHISHETLFTKKIGVYLTSILGMIGCILSIAVGFLSPDKILGGNLQNYSLIFISSILIVLLMPLCLLLINKYYATRISR